MAKEFSWDYNAMEKAWFAYYGDEELGFIEYYPKWKKYVWNQGEDIIMSISCLENVCNKLKEFESTKAK